MGVCTLVGGVGSEFVQSKVSVRFPNNCTRFFNNSHYQRISQNREFDPLEIVSNLLGSGLGLLMCTWYHRRMLERKRLTKLYQPVSTEGDVEFENDGEELQDLEAGTPQRAHTDMPPVLGEAGEGGNKGNASV